MWTQELGRLTLVKSNSFSAVANFFSSAVTFMSYSSVLSFVLLVIGVLRVTHSFQPTTLFLVLGFKEYGNVLPLQCGHCPYIQSILFWSHTAMTTKSGTDGVEMMPIWYSVLTFEPKFHVSYKGSSQSSKLDSQTASPLLLHLFVSAPPHTVLQL